VAKSKTFRVGHNAHIINKLYCLALSAHRHALLPLNPLPSFIGKIAWRSDPRGVLAIIGAVFLDHLSHIKPSRIFRFCIEFHRVNSKCIGQGHYGNSCNHCYLIQPQLIPLNFLLILRSQVFPLFLVHILYLSRLLLNCCTFDEERLLLFVLLY